MYRKFFKRFFDLSVSLLGIIILSPIFLIIAIAVKITSKGPIIFKQQRIGKNVVCVESLFLPVYLNLFSAVFNDILNANKTNESTILIV